MRLNWSNQKSIDFPVRELRNTKNTFKNSVDSSSLSGTCDGTNNRLESTTTRTKKINNGSAVRYDFEIAFVIDEFRFYHLAECIWQ